MRFTSEGSGNAPGNGNEASRPEPAQLRRLSVVMSAGGVKRRALRPAACSPRRRLAVASVIGAKIPEVPGLAGLGSGWAGLGSGWAGLGLGRRPGAGGSPGGHMRRAMRLSRGFTRRTQRQVLTLGPEFV